MFGRIVILSIISIQHAHSFVVSVTATPSSRPWMSQVVEHRQSVLTLAAEGSMTSKDIINRAREASGMPVEEDEEQIFDAALLDDMQGALLLLEKRVKDGPGALDADEVRDFIARTDRIVSEMKGNDAGATDPAPKPVSAPAPAKASPSITSVEASWGGMERKTPAMPSKPSKPEGADDNEEGPAYEGTGGLGLAKGTRNTYLIEGMEEMSSEEYRAALQQSVIDAQAERRRIRSSMVGNRAAHDYLSTLGYGGTSKALSRGKDAED